MSALNFFPLKRRQNDTQFRSSRKPIIKLTSENGQYMIDVEEEQLECKEN